MTDWNTNMDEAPKDGTPVLVWRNGESYVARWRKGYEEWGVCVEPVDNSVRTFIRIGPVMFAGMVQAPGPTAWMPLPSPPEPQP